MLRDGYANRHLNRQSRLHEDLLINYTTCDSQRFDGDIINGRSVSIGKQQKKWRDDQVKVSRRSIEN